MMRRSIYRHGQGGVPAILSDRTEPQSRANTDLRSPADFRRLVVYQQGDTIVRLEDIADVELGAADYDTQVRYTGQTAVFAGVFPQPNANVIDVMRAVRVELADLQQAMPAGLDASIGKTPPSTCATPSTR